MKVKDSFPLMVDAILPVIHRVLVLRWSSNARHSSIPTFLKANRGVIALVFPTASMDRLIAAGDKWLTQCPDDVLQLHTNGLLGEAMFASKLKDVVSHNLASQISQKVADLRKEAIAKKTVLNEDLLLSWREQVVVHVEAAVQSLDLLPAKRSVSIPYRNGEICEVPVSSLIDHIDFSLVCVFKSAAIAANVLQPMDCEAMMGFCSAADDDGLVVFKDWFDKVVFLIFYNIILFKNSFNKL